MISTTADDARTLFNRKADTWHLKYGPNGTLHPRLRQVTAGLSESCPPPARVLDFGCGTGDIATAMERRGYEVTGCDVAEKMIELARSTSGGTTVEWVCLEPGWRVLPFGDGSFDGVVASSVFEYLVDVPSVAGELSRVLRPGGVLLLTVPNPFNRLRRLEGLIQRALANHRFPSLLQRIPKVDAYFTYLRLSRNRSAGDWWERVLRSARLVALKDSDFSVDAWQRQAKAPLILLTVKREGVQACAH